MMWHAFDHGSSWYVCEFTSFHFNSHATGVCEFRAVAKYAKNCGNATKSRPGSISGAPVHSLPP